MANDLDSARYIAFVSFRADGTPASTPVWCVPYEDGYAFTSEADAWKMRRITANPNVTVQVCSMRGRPKSGAALHNAHAVRLAPEVVSDVRLKLRKKYWIAYRLLIDRGERKAKRRGEPVSMATAAIKFVLND